MTSHITGIKGLSMMALFIGVAKMAWRNGDDSIRQ